MGRRPARRSPMDGLVMRKKGGWCFFFLSSRPAECKAHIFFDARVQLTDATLAGGGLINYR